MPFPDFITNAIPGGDLLGGLAEQALGATPFGAAANAAMGFFNDPGAIDPQAARDEALAGAGDSMQTTALNGGLDTLTNGFTHGIQRGVDTFNNTLDANQRWYDAGVEIETGMQEAAIEKAVSRVGNS